jgi:hypothetical protein
MDAAK